MKSMKLIFGLALTILYSNIAIAGVQADMEKSVKAATPNQYIQLAEGEDDKKKPKEKEGLSGQESHSDEDDC